MSSPPTNWTEVPFLSTVPTQGWSPSLPVTCSWHLRTSVPPLNRCWHSTFPSGEEAQSPSCVQTSPGFLVPFDDWGKAASHEGPSSADSQKSGLVEAACSSDRQACPAVGCSWPAQTR
jgi:hypothetical protein